MGTKDILLDIARRAGRFMLAGNREYFAGLDFKEGEGFQHFGGDSLNNQEEYRHRISDEQAYQLLLDYWRGHGITWGNKRFDSDEQVAAHAQEWTRRSGGYG